MRIAPSLELTVEQRTTFGRRTGEGNCSPAGHDSEEILHHVPFTPTGSSWLNMVERFLPDLTQNRFGRGVFPDVEELITAIETHIDHHHLKN